MVMVEIMQEKQLAVGVAEVEKDQIQLMLVELVKVVKDQLHQVGPQVYPELQ